MRIHATLAPSERPAEAAVAIVVDVLRAGTTIVAALEAGYRRVLCVQDLDDARERARRLGDGAVLAGERECVKPEGFRLGNSPRDLAGPPLGESLVLTTTNGTKAIVSAAARAETVFVGSLWNLEACVAAAARAAQAAAGDVVIRCAGVRGEFALDDAYTAGRYVQELAGRLDGAERSDAARAAEAVAAAYETPYAAFAASQSARNLFAVDMGEDVRACARVGLAEAVPQVAGVEGPAVLMER
jgi:2-phosphosulfolactate phosphatase